MAYNDKFGPNAQTPEQRASILRQMLVFYSQVWVKLPAHAPTLHQRYVAGELSWTEVCALCAMPLPV